MLHHHLTLRKNRRRYYMRLECAAPLHYKLDELDLFPSSLRLSLGFPIMMIARCRHCAYRTSSMSSTDTEQYLTPESAG
jgi:hypothetical protein